MQADESRLPPLAGPFELAQEPLDRAGMIPQPGFHVPVANHRLSGTQAHDAGCRLEHVQMDPPGVRGYCCLLQRASNDCQHEWVVLTLVLSVVGRGRGRRRATLLAALFPFRVRGDNVPQARADEPGFGARQSEGCGDAACPGHLASWNKGSSFVEGLDGRDRSGPQGSTARLLRHAIL